MGHDVRTEVQDDALGALPGLDRSRPELRWVEEGAPRTRTVEGRVVVGTATEVDLVLADAAVSRIHAELEVREDGLWIRDLGSRNGTWVEGVRVKEARLDEGARLRLGSTTVEVRHPRAPEPVELWAFDRFGPLLGKSAAMRELFARIGRFAPTEATVLIEGETGSGKELVARAIHDSSPRADAPFVVVDLGALPDTLLESELFGHVKGAFTGAHHARAGAIELAEGGTVLLDEVGEVPLHLQSKLLRLLSTSTLRRLGDDAERKIDVRFCSATHRDLRTMVNQGLFREDLYFRLAVLTLRVPPLRERREDIALLADSFVPPGVSGAVRADVLRGLEGRPWPGNVRELRNFVERAVALGADEAVRSLAPLSPKEAFPSVTLDVPFKELRERWLDHLEREYLAGLLERHGGNVSAVAHAAGLDRTYVHRLIKKHDL